MRPYTRAVLAAAVTLAVLAVCVPGVARAQELQENKGAAKVAQLLEGSGYNYNQAAEGVWAIPFNGNSFKNFTVIVIATPDGNMLVLSVILAKKADMKASDALWLKLLHANNDFDRVKVGIDDDEDAFVRIDIGLRTLDVDELKVNVEQIAAASDEAYASILPYLNAPATPPQ